MPVMEPGVPGSSPLARGISRLPSCRCTGWRLIPAGAGHIPSCQTLCRTTQAHPRWRGAYVHADGVAGRSVGSSPLARGIFTEVLKKRFTKRLIPAGAGHMTVSASSPPGWQAHPRWRGAYFNTKLFQRTLHGSSPLARGIFYNLAFALPHGGLIPAGAGHMITRLLA